MTNERFYSPEEVAQLLNISVWMVTKQLRKGSMPGCRFGGQWRVSETQLESYVQTHTTQCECAKA